MGQCFVERDDVFLREIGCTLGETRVFLTDLLGSFGVCCLLFAWLKYKRFQPKKNGSYLANG